MKLHLPVLLLATALQMIAGFGLKRLIGQVVIVVRPEVTWACLASSLLLAAALIWRRQQNRKTEIFRGIKFLMVFLLASWGAIYCVTILLAPTILSFICTLNGLTILFILALSLAAAVTEELLFRGAVLDALHERLGPYVAVILSAAIFTLAHGGLSIAIFLGSLVYGYSAISTRSLIGAISAHFLNDVLVFFAAIVNYNHSKISETTWTGFGMATFILIFSFDLLLALISTAFSARKNPTDPRK